MFVGDLEGLGYDADFDNFCYGVHLEHDHLNAYLLGTRIGNGSCDAYMHIYSEVASLYDILQWRPLPMFVGDLEGLGYDADFDNYVMEVIFEAIHYT